MTEVLIVDDDDALGDLLDSMLVGRPCVSARVASIAEARAIFAHTAVDIVLLDGVLPDGLGLELVRECGRMTPAPRFIIMSSNWRRSGSDLPTGSEMGVAVLMHKPFSDEEMIGCLDTVFQQVREPVRLPRIGRRRSSGRSVYAQSLKRARGSFAKTVSGRVDELAIAVTDAHDGPTAARLNHVLRLAMRLHATAGTYGYFEVSIAARSIGETFDELLTGKASMSELLWHSLTIDVDSAREAAQQAGHSRARPRPSSTAVQTERATHAATLLVVDADPDFLSISRALGHDLLHRIVTAQNGQEALAIARCTRLDGALLNVSIDGQSGGIELAKELRAVAGCATLPLAFTTDQDAMASRIAAAAVAADLFIAKPIDKQTFADAARYLLRSRDGAAPTVLVADADVGRRRRFAASLAGAGLQVVELQRADSLLEALSRHVPDLALVADELPPWSGGATIRAIRMMPQHKELPLLMTGAAEVPDARIAAAAAGADELLGAGISADELVARVRLRLERRAEQRVQRERDTLTGLLLRRAFVERFNSRLAELRRTRGQVSLALLDIDLFKRVNDELGHLVGDRVLAAFGHFLGNSYRAEDLRCRWGGEEFVVGCFEQDGETMKMITARSLATLRERTFQDDQGQPFHVSFSAGVATWPADGEDLVAVMKRADERLYEAKRAGRARVVWR